MLYHVEGGGTHVRTGDNDKLVFSPPGHALLFDGFSTVHAAAASPGPRVHMVFVATGEADAFTEHEALQRDGVPTLLNLDEGLIARRANRAKEEADLAERIALWKTMESEKASKALKITERKIKTTIAQTM